MENWENRAGCKPSWVLLCQYISERSSFYRKQGEIEVPNTCVYENSVADVDCLAFCEKRNNQTTFLTLRLLPFTPNHVAKPDCEWTK